jgi:hypothetical protein
MTEPRGAAAGPLCVYFHGCPGGPAETGWFEAAARGAGVRLVALDRAVLAPAAPMSPRIIGIVSNSVE